MGERVAKGKGMQKKEEGSGDLSKEEADEYWGKKDKSGETWGRR